MYGRWSQKPSQRKTNVRRTRGCLRRLKNTEKIREVKCKGERERYTQWHADFQRIARRDKKVFTSEHCKN